MTSIWRKSLSFNVLFVAVAEDWLLAAEDEEADAALVVDVGSVDVMSLSCMSSPIFSFPLCCIRRFAKPLRNRPVLRRRISTAVFSIAAAGDLTGIRLP